MNRWLYLIFILFFIFSCALAPKQAKHNKQNKNLQLFTNIYEINQDSLLVKVIILFPVSNLVFIKNNKEFQASIESSLRVEQNNSGLQIKRISNTHKIIKKYYDDTRSNNLYQIEYDFLLKKDEYKIIANIKDIDSYNVWDISKNIKSNDKTTLLLHYYSDKVKKYIIDEIIKDVNTVWIEIPKYKFNENYYEYHIVHNEDILNRGTIKNCIENSNYLENIFFECPILINKDIFGDIEIRIISDSKEIFISSLSIYEDKLLWSSNIDEILGVMSYIFSYNQIKILYSLPEEEQIAFIEDYIKIKDPDLTTEKNEFLELIKTRFQYVNDNFSKYNSGWKTDRGKIYIINGSPESIDSYYNNIKYGTQKIINIEKWYYEHHEFIFSDEFSYGELKLVNQF